MLERALVYEIDDEADKTIKSVEEQLKNGGDFAALARELSDDEASKQNGGAITAKKTDQDPAGIVAAVSNLDPGETTEIGQAQIDDSYYYYIARLNSKNDDDINYSVIMIKLNKLDDDFAQLIKDGKIKEYISVSSSDSFSE